jgi:hypothetical protein
MPNSIHRHARPPYTWRLVKIAQGEIITNACTPVARRYLACHFEMLLPRARL